MDPLHGSSGKSEPHPEFLVFRETVTEPADFLERISREGHPRSAKIGRPPEIRASKLHHPIAGPVGQSGCQRDGRFIWIRHIEETLNDGVTGGNLRADPLQ